MGQLWGFGFLIKRHASMRQERMFPGNLGSAESVHRFCTCIIWINALVFGFVGACIVRCPQKTMPEFVVPARLPIYPDTQPVSILKEKVELNINQREMNRNPGNYLRVHRRESGFNQEELGAILGCDGGAVSRFEWSHSLPSLPKALALEILFMVPISELFNGLSEAVRHRIEHQI